MRYLWGLVLLACAGAALFLAVVECVLVGDLNPPFDRDWE